MILIFGAKESKHTVVWILLLSIYLKQEEVKSVDNGNHHYCWIHKLKGQQPLGSRIGNQQR